jgi:hypothetical protein
MRDGERSAWAKIVLDINHNQSFLAGHVIRLALSFTYCNVCHSPNGKGTQLPQPAPAQLELLTHQSHQKFR